MGEQERQVCEAEPTVCTPDPAAASTSATPAQEQGSPPWAPPQADPGVDQARADMYRGMYDHDAVNGVAANDNGAPAPPALKDGEQSVRDQFQQKAYEQLGVSKEDFDKMDPQDRNQIITRAYAKMYESNPQDMKWSGMAAYASKMFGGAMEDSPLANLAGGPGNELQKALADGNAAVFQDIYWQHLAYQQGGMDALKKAAEQGQLPKDQLESWQKIADAAKARQDAGNCDDAKKADDMTWEGNKGLLEHEQKVLLQQEIYSKHPEAFKWLSDQMQLQSPVPGGTPFQKAVPGGDISNTDDRWKWINDKMLPEWKQRETQHRDDVMEDMRRFEKVPLKPGGVPDYPID